MLHRLFSNKALTVFVSAACFCLLAASSAAAANFTVNSSDDVDDLVCNAVHCSLREAVNAANTAAGDDTIIFSGVTSIQLTAALSDITTTIIVNGGSGVTLFGGRTGIPPATTPVTFRAFNVTGTGNLSLGNLTVSDFLQMTGGGLFNQFGGTISLTNCVISGNLATSLMSGGNGGGIFNAGMMTLANTVVNVNSAAGQGGGILNNSTGVMTLTDSTIGFNDADTAFTIGGGGISNAGMLTVNRSIIAGNLTGGNGGGVFNLTGTINLINSTVRFNSAFNFNGGGIFNGNSGTVTITNSTITDQNFAAVGGGIFNDLGSTVNLRNSIVAGNNSPSAPDVSGNYNAPAFNLIGKADGSTGFANNVNGNIVGTIAMSVDPLLAPIANNGGATQTYALMSGSPAANTGSNALAVDPTTTLPLTTDQRGAGFPRINGGRVDIGSFESAFIPSAASVSIGGRVTTARGRGIFRARISMTDSSGTARSVFTNPFGYYQLADVPAGGTYIFTASHRRYVFPAQIVSVTEDIENFNFTAQP